jgi:hypothetical protein
MSTFTIVLTEENGEINVTGGVEPALQPGQEVFSTIEIVGLFMRENMGEIVKAAIEWAKTPYDEPPEEPAIKAPRLILP